MTRDPINRGGWLAIGLAVLAGVIAIVREIVRYSRGGTVDWGHVALGVAVPVIIYGIVSARRPTTDASRSVRTPPSDRSS